MGFTPAEVDEMSFWQFNAALDGFVRANKSEDDQGLTPAEFDDLAEMIPVGGLH